MLVLDHVTKAYSNSGVNAVDDLCLNVKRGEIYGFIGPNGAGKTTTIKMICGILTLSSGNININGFDIKTNSLDAKRSIGYVPDNHEVYETLSGSEYLNFMADMYNVSTADRKARIEHYLSLFSLENSGNDTIRSYSHGMKQKLLITGALLHKPALWILDEPLTGLDPKSAMLLKQEMRAHADAGNAVFFSTHVLEVAEKLCDRIGIINNGKLIASGTLEELRKNANESLENIFMQCTEGAEV